MTATTRVHWIDSLRGLAMLAIFLAHASASFILGFHELWPYYDRYASHDYLIALLYLQGLLPPFFFLIAGYLAAQSLARQSYLSHLRKRFYRLGLPFLVGFFLFIFPSELLYLISQVFPPDFWLQQQGLDSAQIFSHIQLVLAQQKTTDLLRYFDNTQVYWFLLYLLIIECFSGVLKQLLIVKQETITAFLKRYERFLFSYQGLTLLLVILFTSILPTPVHLNIATPTSFIPDITALIEFLTLYLIGMACHDYPDLLKQFTQNYDIKILIGIFIGFAFFYLAYLMPETYLNFWVGKSAWFCYNLFFWFTILGTTAGFYQYYNQANAFLQYLSDAAYWIYFIHLPVVIFLQGYFAELSLNPIFKYPLLLLSACIIVLLPYHLWIRRGRA